MARMSPEVSEAVRKISEDLRAQRSAESPFRIAAKPLLDALLGAGIDTTDFGSFGWASFSTFDFSGAAATIVEWLPRISDPQVKEAMVRSLADQPTARGEGTRRLIAEFHGPITPAPLTSSGQ